jgi:hypothetical protein
MAVKVSNLTVSKNLEKSGAWLAAHSWEIDGEPGSAASAWTTQAAAKRWAANQVGRSRLAWNEITSTELSATHSEKIK